MWFMNYAYIGTYVWFINYNLKQHDLAKQNQQEHALGTRSSMSKSNGIFGTDDN